MKLLDSLFLFFLALPASRVAVCANPGHVRRSQETADAKPLRINGATAGDNHLRIGGASRKMKTTSKKDKKRKEKQEKMCWMSWNLKIV